LWYDLREVLLGALEYDDLGKAHLRHCEVEIPAALPRVQEAERLTHAEVEATGAMLD
jgi:hypothetical protein